MPFACFASAHQSEFAGSVKVVAATVRIPVLLCFQIYQKRPVVLNGHNDVLKKIRELVSFDTPRSSRTDNVGIMYLLAKFHPGPDDPVMASLPAAYCLTLSDLRIIISRLNGCPVTHEHFGIHTAVGSLLKVGITDLPPPATVVAALNANTEAEASVLGRVIDAFESHDGAFWCTLYVNLQMLPGLDWLLQSKIIKSVSLTHMMSPDQTPHPLEVSLVQVPARPTCDIALVTPSALAISAYKARLQHTPTSTMEVTEATNAAPATMMAAMNEFIKQNPLVGNVIAARLAEMQSFVDKSKEDKQKLTTATRALADAEEALSAQKVSANVDFALLRSQLQQLHNGLPPAAAKNCGIENFEKLEKDITSSDSSEVLAATLRTIMCCNQTMMMQNMQTARAPAAPVAAEEAHVAKRSRVVDAPPVSQEELLKRALAETFEM